MCAVAAIGSDVSIQKSVIAPRGFRGSNIMMKDSSLRVIRDTHPRRDTDPKHFACCEDSGVKRNKPLLDEAVRSAVGAALADRCSDGVM